MGNYLKWRNTPTCVGRTSSTASSSRAVRKHPHVRGEDRRCAYRCGMDVETPPRAWGGLQRRHRHDAAGRNTPTCVGRTGGCPRCGSRLGKHPHVRGEDLSGRVLSSPTRETPPRAWGGRFFLPCWHCPPGNTPTCVGRTAGGGAAGRIWKKHPHVRGEDPLARPAGRQPAETPPRAWGGPQLGNLQHGRARNTPTCVGRTGCRAWISPSRRKHPHVRGEDWIWPNRGPGFTETPPRAWGGLRQVEPGRTRAGNTPTCVGRTPRPEGRQWHPQKHPHVRGEDRHPQVIVPGGGETPPRAWGGPLNAGAFLMGARNTPTCVGRTNFLFVHGKKPRKHPHVRGEDV